MDAKTGDSVLFVDGDRTHDAQVTRAYGDDRSCVDLRYFDEEYVEPTPDPRPEDWQPEAPRADHVNVTAVPHASHTSGDVPRWQVTQPATVPAAVSSKPAPKPAAASPAPANDRPAEPA